MTIRITELSCIALICLAICGCGPKTPARVKTYPVIGKLTVDGEAPGSPIQVYCHPVDGMDPNFPTVSECVTNDDGTFQISTYLAGDGVPAGDYILTFEWKEFNLLSRGYGGPDKLKKKYSDKEKSPYRITVEPGQQLDLGTLDLTTK